VSARDRILTRLRTTRGALPTVAAPPQVAFITATAEECISRFAVETAALGMDLFVEATAAQVRDRVTTVVSDKRVLAWNAEHLPYSVGDVLVDAATGETSREGQAAADIGVTGCDAAIAETGSLVLFSAPGRSRAVSLLPPIHLAIVRREQVVFTMAEVLTTHASRFRDTASCTIVTGPSRTADIELTLTLGIHGPGKVIVVLGP
jgi:L-lactate dehydrogenase complex protein LldG